MKKLNIIGALLIISIWSFFFIMIFDLYKAINEPYTVYHTYTYSSNPTRTTYFISQFNSEYHFMNCIRNPHDGIALFDTITDLYRIGDTINLKQVNLR